MTVASTGVGIQPYTPMKLLLSREAHLKAMVVNLEATNAILPFPLYASPMLPLAAILAIFKATLDSPSVALKDKVQITKTGRYLAKRLATMAMLVDKSTPAMAAFYDAITCGKGGRLRELGKTLLFDVNYGLIQRVPLTKLVELDGDIYLYFATLMVATLVWASETLVMAKGTRTMMLTREAFNNMLLKEFSHSY